MTLLTIAVLVIAGWPIGRALDPQSSGVRAAGQSLLFGSGAAAMILFLLAAFGVAWSATSLFLTLGLLSFACAVIAVRGRQRVGTTALPATGSRTWGLFDAVTGLLVIAHLLFASLERPYEWDYFGIWGFKGHLFYVTRSIPWPILRDVDFAWIARGHPLFAPLLYDVAAILGGEWRDRDLGLLTTAFGVAVILVVRGLVSEEHPGRWRRSLVTLAVAPAALSMWVGLAEPLLIGFATSGILLVRRGLRRDAPRSISAGAVLLGCAAMTKNEGLAFVLSAAIAVVLSSRDGWSRLIRLWPAAAVLAPWIIARRVVHVQTDFLLGGLSERLQHLRDAGHMVRQLFITPVDDHIFWWAALLAIVLHWRRAGRFERFLVVVLASQFFFDVLQNFLVPWDPDPHIQFSWNRILDQLAALTAFTAATLLVNRAGNLLPLRRREEVMVDG